METVNVSPAPTRLKNLMPAGTFVFAAWIAAAILSSRCLYADGAHEFVRVLQAQGFVSLMWSRHFAFYIYEFPLVLAIKLGVTNLVWLRLAFGLGCFMPWPLAMICCRWISPQNFWLVVVGCAAGYLNAAFMAVGEHIMAHALFWLSLFVILFARPLKPMAAVILMASAVGMLFSYESQLFLCVPLALLASWRSWREQAEGSGWAWIMFLAAAAFFFAGVSVGLCGVLMPELPRNFIGFKAGTLGIWAHLGWTLTWTIVWAGLMLVACFSDRFWHILSGKGGFYFLFASVAVWGTWPLLAPGRLDNGVQNDNRVLDLLVPLALLPVAMILRFRPQWLEFRRGRIVPLVAALFIAQSLWQISATVNWYRDVVWMREILAAKSGIVKVRSTALAVDGMEGRELYKNAMGGRFDWVWPCLSISLAPDQKINCLVCSEVFLDPETRKRFWQPFDPLKPETLPNLGHYGLDFSGYAEAMSKLPPRTAP
jgi:hypothetical protein